MMASIVSALKAYIQEYAGLEEGAPVWVNYLGETVKQYSIVPIAGSMIVETDILGNTVREYPFVFESVDSTADEVVRLESVGFYEAFADWLESQTELGVLPVLAVGKNPTKVEALGWGSLFEQGESQTGVYQIQCKLTYEQSAA